MITLSDASVEAAARALCDKAPDAFADFDAADASIQQMWKDEARAAITAYLQAEIEAGRAKEAIAAPVGTKWSATSNANSYSPTAGEFCALILSLEPSK